MATHFHEVFMNGILKRTLPIGLAHMELIVDREVQALREDGSAASVYRGSGGSTGRVVGVTPLFKLAPGLCLNSYATHCAESYGIHPDIIERALHVSNAIATYNMQEILDQQMTAEEYRKIDECEGIVRRMLLMDWDDESRGMTTMQKLAEVLGETSGVEERGGDQEQEDQRYADEEERGTVHEQEVMEHARGSGQPLGAVEGDWQSSSSSPPPHHGSAFFGYAGDRQHHHHQQQQLQGWSRSAVPSEYYDDEEEDEMRTNRYYDEDDASGLGGYRREGAGDDDDDDDVSEI